MAAALSEAQSVRFGLTGQAVCNAIEDFEFEEAGGTPFRASGADTTRCDSASRLELIFSR